MGLIRILLDDYINEMKNKKVKNVLVNLWERQIRELQKTSATMIHMANKLKTRIKL